jgi:menaquinone-dependent protoporphyrinogen oxidase
MKTLILYATKHGAAKDIAERIAKLIPDSVVCNIKSDSIPVLDDFNCIIFGTSVYAGKIRKEASAFLANHEVDLASKHLGLFLSGMSPQEDSQYFPTNFPKMVLDAVVVKSLLGGAFNPETANFFEKLIMKMVTKQSGPISTIDDERISAFVDALVSSY